MDDATSVEADCSAQGQVAGGQEGDPTAHAEADDPDLAVVPTGFVQVLDRGLDVGQQFLVRQGHDGGNDGAEVDVAVGRGAGAMEHVGCHG